MKDITKSLITIGLIIMLFVFSSAIGNKLFFDKFEGRVVVKLQEMIDKDRLNQIEDKSSDSIKRMSACIKICVNAYDECLIKHKDSILCGQFADRCFNVCR